MDDFAEVGENLAEGGADGAVEGVGIDADGHVHEPEGAARFALYGLFDVGDERT